MRFLFLLLLAAFTLRFPTTIQAQDSLLNWRGARATLDRDLADELQELANWCRSAGLQSQVEPTFALYRKRDLNRMYVFPAQENSTPEAGDDRLGQWQAKINEIRLRHAGRIYDLAKRAAKAGQGGEAFRLAHEVLHFDPDQAEVRRMLGHRKRDDGWRVASEKISVRKSRKTHPQFGWEGGQYLIVRTPFFEIESNANEKRTVALAEKLERWHTIWRQVFFDYWSNPRVTKKMFDGQTKVTFRSKKRFKVVFFRNLQQFTQQMERFVPGAAGSSGYYSSNQRVAYFPDGNLKTEDTWRHEMTHQLFRESVGTKGEPFEDQFIWLDEGIATWFESLTDFGDYVTLGGFDSRRIQYARIRKFSEQFFIPLEQLTGLGRVGLQKHPELVRIYSQSAGVADMLMNDDAGSMAKNVTEFLRLIYAGKLKPGSFEKLVGKTFDQLDKRYPEFLSVDADLITSYLSQPLTRTELSLPNGRLDQEAFEAIGTCRNLRWLDVSRNKVSGANITALKECHQLSQLFLVGCVFEPATFQAMQSLPSLTELEMSGSNLNDQHLGELAKLRNITTLRITATSISDTGIRKLATMSSLRQLDVSRTNVTEAGVQNLQRSIPNLQVVR
jgi:hypothetical protein